MQVKEIAKQVIDKLPDESSLDYIIHPLYIWDKFWIGEPNNPRVNGYDSLVPCRA